MKKILMCGILLVVLYIRLTEGKYNAGLLSKHLRDDLESLRMKSTIRIVQKRQRKWYYLFLKSI